MIKNLSKIVASLILLTLPAELNKNYSPNLEKKEYLEKIEKRKIDIENYKKNISEIEEKIIFINRKRNFFLMRIQEKNLFDSISKDYIYKLKETEKELKKYQNKKDSLYNLINKTPYFK
jgi:hypothetical protein